MYVELDEVPGDVQRIIANAIRPVLFRWQMGNESVGRYLECVLPLPS